MSAKEDNYSNLSRFFQEEYQALNGFVRSRIGNTTEEQAEDVVQDVALRLFSRSDDLGRINNIAGYVYHAIRNRIVDIRRGKDPDANPEEEFWERLADLAQQVHPEYTEEYPDKLIREMRKAIGALRPEYRDIILAIDFEGYTYREIAAEWGVSPGTLMSRRHRALHILNRKLSRQH
ncbi:RNA polymerase sigma-70 factor, ECF subfamily [Robiginitalea myxolifaciens]|uniref:RNA polymerase sigma-70 factor, ECF subfamily n=1 Tax=Robiginitalea myxolifaciens TaxID=400055 RepID=A0A1I6FYV7_9FLAO|nr:sigma-70 family RNA polymerase sigma factor [Robiginitalea myxolifaciens]SFR35086.1 RNA polymerase sigma-70 factor, ECF subfamily [Robiginitalea myxolifaciens]